jgi:hypothetical protein
LQNSGLYEWVRLLFVQLKKYGEALPLYAELLERSKRVLGEDDEETIHTMGKYASTLKYVGKDKEAYSVFGELFEHQEKTLGPQHARTMRTWRKMECWDLLEKFQVTIILEYYCPRC